MSLDASSMQNADEDAYTGFVEKGGGFALSEFLPVTLEEEGID
jgi:hypothetical protein